MRVMKYGMNSTLSLWLWLLAPAVGASNTAAFYADFPEAQWSVDGSVFECRMVQQIPRLGEAVFHHQAGEPLHFRLQSAASPMEAGRALLTSLPPAWRHELEMRDLGYVDIVRGEQPLELDPPRSRTLISELTRGMVPTVMRRAWYSDEESIRVGISPVNFQQAHDQYQQCVGGLLPVNFSQIERTTIFWEPGQEQLDAETRELLDDIVRYTEADSGIHSFEINGFTDSSGTPRENLELSRVRAFAVHDYLVEGGVDEAMLETRYFGSTEEYRIVRNERTEADRDRNRRVTIRIRRSGPLPPEEGPEPAEETPESAEEEAPVPAEEAFQPEQERS